MSLIRFLLPLGFVALSYQIISLFFVYFYYCKQVQLVCNTTQTTVSDLYLGTLCSVLEEANRAVADKMACQASRGQSNSIEASNSDPHFLLTSVERTKPVSCIPSHFFLPTLIGLRGKGCGSKGSFLNSSIDLPMFYSVWMPSIIQWQSPICDIIDWGPDALTFKNNAWNAPSDFLLSIYRHL